MRPRRTCRSSARGGPRGARFKAGEGLRGSLLLVRGQPAAAAAQALCGVGSRASEMPALGGAERDRQGRKGRRQPGDDGGRGHTGSGRGGPRAGAGTAHREGLEAARGSPQSCARRPGRGRFGAAPPFPRRVRALPPAQTPLPGVRAQWLSGPSAPPGRTAAETGSLAGTRL